MTEAETTIATTTGASADLSSVIIALLKGVIYQQSDSRLWGSVVKLQPRIRDYVLVLGLELILDEAEGYAFLRTRTHADDETESDDSTGRLMARRQLSFPVSLLLALLRKRLAEFDASGGETRLVLTGQEIAELVKVFLPEGSNETKLINQIDASINKIVQLGFLRALKHPTNSEPVYEVQRIIKAFVDAQWLSDFDNRLEQYIAKLKSDSGQVNDD